MSFRTALLIMVIMMALNFVVSGLFGFLASVHYEIEVPDRETQATLALTFSEVSGAENTWSAVEGDALQGALVRRAWVRGVANGQRYSEQTLKVGWPMTNTRGFVRVRSGVTEFEGALMVEGDPAAGNTRFWPVQVVWPGLLINSLLMSIVIIVLQRIFTRL